MKTFSFYIPSENYTYSFSLESEVRNGITYVDATKMRPQYPPEVNLIMQVQPMLSELNDFQNDLNTFVSFMKQIGGKVTRDMIIQAHLMLCGKHINQYGRLILNDLFSYADLATLVAYAIYQLDMDAYYKLHWQCIMDARHKYPDSLYRNQWEKYY